MDPHLGKICSDYMAIRQKADMVTATLGKGAVKGPNLVLV